MKLAIAAFLPTVGLAVVIAAPAPNEAGPVLYFPTKVGTKWAYAHPDYEQTREVQSVEDKDGEKLVTIDDETVLQTGAKLRRTEVISVSGKGLFRRKMGKTTFDPPFCLLRFPHKVGDTWEVKGPPSPGHEAEIKIAITVHDSEQVEVPAGRYTAIRVVWAATNDGPPARTQWYAPHVGIVKSVTVDVRGPRELVLKSFTPAR